MFFTGDASTRKRVDLGGRSSKESDRQVLLEQARLDRKRRLVHRQQTSAAIKIQKCFRGMKDVKMARTEVREQFHVTYGDHGEKADWHCFGPDSEFLRQLLFFFTANNTSDVALLVKACRLLLQHLQQSVNLRQYCNPFAGLDYPQKNSLVDLRVKKLAYACLQAIFHNRNHYKNKLLMPSTCSYWPAVALFETVACLTNPELPWNCSVIDYLMERKVFWLLRCIILAGVAIDFLTVSTFLLEVLPSVDSSPVQKPVDDELTMDDEVLSPDLQKQISSSIDSRLLQHLVNALLKATCPTGYSEKTWPSNVEVEAISAVCTFLHVTFCTLPHELIMTLLAYRTELLPALWNYIKRCHENQRWPFYSILTAHIPGDTPGWLLPLAVFCPLYKHMLKFVDTEEFYEQETPVKIKDIPSLVIIIKQALWQLLWTTNGHVPSQKSSRSLPDDKKLSVEVINRKARVAMSELLSQLQDWNNRRQFMSADDFHLQEARSETFVSQIRISFVNEFGVEEPGVDGGGIFKDFMENIIQAAFDVQSGLFKETPDHLLYPNPGSALVHEQHLQFFHFLGTLLGKAMSEGILVDIPFATFFLSKLKEKSNFLHDLPSLDPELYRHLLFLKHYKGDVSELELYFVAVNNEYGEQTEEELIPGGKDMRVTKDNAIAFIHLVANYRLNFQIRTQSLHFLRGFQQLIQKEWIEMFNEHEIQLFISGSLESMNVDDLRSNTLYTGGYHHEHQVIEMFWEVLKSFSLEYQKKFLRFVTGCSRGPLLGFKYLEPKFCIQRAAPLDVTEEHLGRLPTSATCMNLLKLPPYASKEQMRTKLIYSISADAGFDLS
ncbi:HECTc [Musa troglodytarum]|uniref:HECT-type E3 ubiquitin transferase n=1 Tax=Musa troglodytarum TaxID=320322 RepID=A0A9E7FWY0_9LILI|nr:HECTc [Musa troglodytarum]URE02388.1 HECTc [Musa troglodytarum]